MHSIKPIILAAGFSTRFGDQHKLNATWRTGNILNHCIATIAAVEDLLPPIIVTNDRTHEFVDHKYHAWRVKNADAATGMLSSIQCGLEHTAPHEAVAFMICLADMPKITDADLSRLIAHFKLSNPLQIVFPQTEDGRKGQPTIIPMPYREEILQLAPTATGLRNWLNFHKSKISPYKTRNFNYLTDIDTPEDLARLNR